MLEDDWEHTWELSFSVFSFFFSRQKKEMDIIGVKKKEKKEIVKNLEKCDKIVL